ncbi:MAG: TIGR01458 family HAD-type hydrolase [Pseudomonadota bacterium]
MLKAILFDLDGVLYEGERPIPGAAEAVAWVRAQRIPHLFVSNTTSRPRAALVEKLAKLGLEVRVDEILTPPFVANRWLHAHVRGPVALYVREATRREFSDIEIASDNAAQVSAVVLGDMGEQWDFHRLNTAFRQLIQPPAPVLVALGMTRYWRAEDGLNLDVAPFVTALSCATGVEPVVLGKPARSFFAAALEILKVTAAETIMIGDDIRSDVAGAQAAGLRALMVRTGKFTPDDLHHGITPDAILDSVRGLPAWWREHAQ